MKLLNQKCTIMLFAIAGLLLSGTCVVASQGNLPGEVVIDSRFQRDVRIVGVSAQPEGSGLVISGHVKRMSRSNRGRIPKGYVAATLYDSDGTVLYEATTPYWPRVIPRTGPMKSRFTINIPADRPEGSVLRLNYRHFPM